MNKTANYPKPIKYNLEKILKRHYRGEANMFPTKVISVNIMYLSRKCHLKSQILKEKPLILIKMSFTPNF